MRHIFSLENTEDYNDYQRLTEEFKEKLSVYQRILQTDYQLIDLPKAIVWTTPELATSVFSEVPIPAFTNKGIIYMTPELTAWKRLFIEQLEGLDYPEIKAFYEQITSNQVLAIAGHELTHHSDLFLDEFDDVREDGIWFEEGMCDYLSRKYLLAEQEFMDISNIEYKLINIFKDKYGNHSLEDFGSSSYEGSLTSIMYDYWRSGFTVRYLVEKKFDNNVWKVFEQYHKWDREGRKVTLLEYFDVANLI
ncbi:hypothetical protein SAMN05421663_11547 [Terribacillus halophilus]|uniref:Uncharacterized protein n=1 Tax=Terribacillus halophilus TaxID=361279 RepID=A0A1G6W931_9BACI|nr:hypothetical protein [Terribacillus halophilus]SDD62331.1 hypothetical protein SAMN05421663_11547 [Terribacillus halophilus]